MTTRPYRCLVSRGATLETDDALGGENPVRSFACFETAESPIESRLDDVEQVEQHAEQDTAFHETDE